MQTDHQPRLRLELAGLGALAGLTLYVIVEHLVDLIGNDLFLLTLCSFLYGLFASLLMLVGPMILQRAVGWALGIGVVGAGLLLLSGLRFTAMDPLLQSVAPIATFVTMIFLSIPFVMSRVARGGDWLHYPTIFDDAWTTFVRLFVSHIFMWLVFGLLWASAYLLTLVELEVLQDLLEEEWFSFTVLGGVFGLSMAILHELSGIVVTLRRIILMLLRLLLPFVAVVTALFIVLVPFRGLEEVFGSWSAAATILSMAMVGITLITAMVDARDEDGAQAALMVWAARLMALVLPLMSGIAVYAIWLRIAQYGWTPDRLLASISALIILTYSLAYCLGVLLRRGDWRQVIRRANIATALGVIAICALWLSPVLNAERISAGNQLNRYLAGKTTPGDLSLWELEHDWGKAGRSVTARLRELSELEDHAALRPVLARLADSNSRWQFNQASRSETALEKRASDIAIIMDALEPQLIPEGLLDAIENYELKNFRRGCETELNDGSGCALAEAELLAEYDGSEVVVFFVNGDHLVSQRVFYNTGGNRVFEMRRSKDTAMDRNAANTLLQKIRAGNFETRNAGVIDLVIDGHVFETKR